MANESSLNQTLDLERSALRALCCGVSENRDALPAAMRDLSDYSWRGAEHRIVYETLARLRVSGGESVAGQLPAQATRMGFPDVDWNLYLQPAEAAQPDISEIIRALKVAAAKELQNRK
jgi:hypothetical protein